jgi:hypothetical protein
VSEAGELKMNINDNELSSMLGETSEHIIEDYLDIFFEIFDDLKIGPYHPPVPLEVLRGIAIAFADASGYRVVLQADIIEPIEGEPDAYRTIGHRDVYAADSSHVVRDL